MELRLRNTRVKKTNRPPEKTTLLRIPLSDWKIIQNISVMQFRSINSTLIIALKQFIEGEAKKTESLAEGKIDKGGRNDIPETQRPITAPKGQG